MRYIIIQSDRKTLTIRISNGMVVVRAPERMSRESIEAYIDKNIAWIEKHIELEKRDRERNALPPGKSEADMKADALSYFVPKIEEMAKKMGLKYSRIKITSAKKRFGSCSTSGLICFSYRLMLYPEAAREYVIVHELAHLVEMNHSPRFYSIIEKYMPDYKERKKLLN